VASVVIPVLVLAASIAGSRLGRNRFDDVTAYFDYIRDVGHPGFVTIIGSAGFFVTAVVACVLALAGRHVARARGALVLTAVLFCLLAIDEMLRLHNTFAGGDVVIRIVYWSIFVVIAYILGPMVRGRLGGRAFLIGLSLLVISELTDFYSVVVSMNSQTEARWSVVEETFGILGAWYMALASLGLVSSFVRLDDRVDDSATVATAGSP
jgi:hypothetical protein